MQTQIYIQLSEIMERSGTEDARDKIISEVDLLNNLVVGSSILSAINPNVHMSITAVIDGQLVKMKAKGSGVIETDVDNFRDDCIKMLEKRSEK